MTDDERPEGHDVVISKGECPKCGSSQGFVTYADGHAHCYGAGCTHFVAPLEGGTQKPSTRSTSFTGASSKLLDPSGHSSPFDRLTKRGIDSETLKKYGVFAHGYNGQMVQVYPYYTGDGNVAGQKLRFPNKDFTFLKEEGAPGIAQCQLFGRHVWGERFDRQVVVCEGELDALTVAQCTGFKTAVVSVNSGAQSAAKNLKANYLWLDRFADIVLWFDDDEAGRLALEESAHLFRVGKVRIAKAFGTKRDSLEPCKDASDMLQANRPGDVQAAVYKASVWRPRGIVNAALNDSDVLAPTETVRSYSYPACMAKLQEMTGGIFAGDVVYHAAGTGVGKSTAFREIEYDLAVLQDVKIGVLSFEDTIRDAKFGLMSTHESERLHLLPIPLPADTDGRIRYNTRMAKVHSEVFGAGNVELFDPETAEWAMDAILGYIRYLAKGLDCEVVFIDPISFIAAGIELTADERRVLDKVAGELAKLAKELNISLQIAHHLKRTSGIPHEEGAPTSLNELRSSGGLANFATCVIGWERNNQAEGESWRVTQSRIIKPVRRTGKSGLADVLYYGENGRLVPSPIPFPPIGKPDGKDTGGSGGGFDAVSNEY